MYLEAAIKLFTFEYQKLLIETGWVLLDALRNVGKPMNTHELSQTTIINMKRANVTMLN